MREQQGAHQDDGLAAAARGKARGKGACPDLEAEGVDIRFMKPGEIAQEVVEALGRLGLLNGDAALALSKLKSG